MEESLQQIQENIENPRGKKRSSPTSTSSPSLKRAHTTTTTTTTTAAAATTTTTITTTTADESTSLPSTMKISTQAENLTTDEGISTFLSRCSMVAEKE